MVAVQFNRAMRFKANKMGYSLNQRGLFQGVVRDPHDRRIKTNTGGCFLISFSFFFVPQKTDGYVLGNIIASETEEEIFKILGKPSRQ